MSIEVNGAPIDYSGLPLHMQDAMERYMEHGIEPGSFLSAVLCNDFMNAVWRADEFNLEVLGVYARWLYQKAPPASFGSIKKFRSWVKERRLQLQQEE